MVLAIFIWFVIALIAVAVFVMAMSFQNARYEQVKARQFVITED